MTHDLEIDRYSLEELIQTLSEIKRGERSSLNFPKALYSLAMEIQKINDKLHKTQEIEEEMKKFSEGFSYRKIKDGME